MHSDVTESEITCKVGVLPTAAVEVLTSVEMGLIHIGNGLGVLRLEDESQVVKMRSLCESNSGFLTILSAPIALKQKIDVWGYTGNALQIMRGIKEQFDNKSILSPGRFVAGI
jgi:glycolate oxidase FAD binding subunit